MADVLVLYYSRSGATDALAREVARGIDSVDGMSARLRTVPEISSVTEATADSVPGSGPPYANTADLDECAGMVIGSPSNFGNMAAPLKYFLDSTLNEWLRGTLVGKPFGAFASTGSLHGGQETTLISMGIPLIHHGMIFVGVPYTEPALSTTTTGGTPYGPTHVTWNREADSLSDEEKQIARALGARVADIAKKLAT
ncbi:MAG TPA: NAD(P)H:quinone oxidoreductase [Woeseiaceae bacterium]|jgi:NAD(P)H dehydrogenase (quinone)|nr:NAD(P)H:quinone oxidoreductase [Woeseiaceae bacterium]